MILAWGNTRLTSMPYGSISEREMKMSYMGRVEGSEVLEEESPSKLRRRQKQLESLRHIYLPHHGCPVEYLEWSVHFHCALGKMLVIKEPHMSLFVAPTGVGKTHLALDLLEKEYFNHFDFIIITCPTSTDNVTYRSQKVVFDRS